MSKCDQKIIKVFNLLNTRSAFFSNVYYRSKPLSFWDIDMTSNSPVWRERWLWSIELRWNREKDDEDLIQRGDHDGVFKHGFIALTSLGLYSVCTGGPAVSVSHGDERNSSSGGSQPFRNFGTYRGAHWSFGQSALRYKKTRPESDNIQTDQFFYDWC